MTLLPFIISRRLPELVVPERADTNNILSLFGGLRVQACKQSRGSLSKRLKTLVSPFVSLLVHAQKHEPRSFVSVRKEVVEIRNV